MEYHIRQRGRQKRTNQWYKDRDPTGAENTMCGARPTAYDVRWYEKAVPFMDKTPCPKCLHLRGESRNRPMPVYRLKRY